jgi:general secretion pathway protein C
MLMKRLPLIVSLVAVIALSASIAYWVMELYKPAQRPMAAIPQASMPDPAPDAGATLFGGQAVTAGPSNYQLTGVVAAGRESVAILVVDGQPPRALVVGKEIASGVTVKEVHPKYVMLSEGGVLKRVDLATDDKAGANLALATPTVSQNQYQPQPMPQPTPQSQQPMLVPSDAAGSTSVPVPQTNGPMEAPGALPPGVPPPPPPVQMPAPTRNMSGQGGQPPTQ